MIAAPVPKITVGDGWTLVRSVGSGWNTAATLRGPNGHAYYVKSLDAKHADNETAAALLYAAAGVTTPTIQRATIAPGMFPSQTGSEGIASQVVSVTPDMLARMRSHPAYRDQVLEGFAVHAWLGNWDAVECNNTATGPDGEPVTIDVGGSLMFRARGGKRVLDDNVQELTSMRTGAAAGYSARRTFSQLSPDHTDPRFVRGVERISAISPDQLRALVDASMTAFSESERDGLVEKLTKRRAHLARVAALGLAPGRVSRVGHLSVGWREAFTASPAHAARHDGEARPPQ